MLNAEPCAALPMWFFVRKLKFSLHTSEVTSNGKLNVLKVHLAATWKKVRLHCVNSVEIHPLAASWRFSMSQWLHIFNDFFRNEDKGFVAYPRVRAFWKAKTQILKCLKVVMCRKIYSHDERCRWNRVKSFQILRNPSKSFKFRLFVNS